VVDSFWCLYIWSTAVFISESVSIVSLYFAVFKREFQINYIELATCSCSPLIAGYGDVSWRSLSWRLLWDDGTTIGRRWQCTFLLLYTKHYIYKHY